MTEQKLPVEVADKIRQGLATHPEILFALLYGSAIESETFRDLDIGIFVDRAIIHASTDLDYSFTLENRLRKALAYPVDVRVINDAPLGFRYNVSRGVALVVNDPPSFYHFLERTWDEYLDFEPIGLQYLKEFQ